MAYTLRRPPLHPVGDESMKARLQDSLRQALNELRAGYSSLVGNSADFTPQPAGRHVDPTGLGGYYCDLRHKAEHARAALPGDGLNRAEYWVIPVAQAALGFWELRIEGHDEDANFLRLADWLIEHGSEEAGGIVWRTDFPVPKYGLGPGWLSAMGQGQAISVLLRAHLLTGCGAYHDAAHAALPALLTPVRDGGAQSTLAGATVLEEYPTQDPSAVLNGWIFALFGVYELGLAGGEPTARELFERSVEGLVRLLPRYDNGWWSLYSLYDHGRPDLAKPFYQRLHPVLLDGLVLLHPDEELRRYAGRWRDQITWAGLTRASLDKLIFRVQRGSA
jgi:heparosan-N-sulfate-glucuronate 5-epimerase